MTKNCTGSIEKYLLRPVGIPAGQEFSTGPGRAGRLPVPVTTLPYMVVYDRACLTRALAEKYVAVRMCRVVL